MTFLAKEMPDSMPNAAIVSQPLTADLLQLFAATGGKWTTYRLMAEDAINAAVATKRLPWAGPCGTHHLSLIGTAGWNSALFTEVAQNYTVPHRPGAIDTRVAKHLAGRQHSITPIRHFIWQVGSPCILTVENTLQPHGSCGCLSWTSCNACNL